MKTYILTATGIEIDSTAARRASLEFERQNFRDEWTRDAQEDIALRFAWDSEPEAGDEFESTPHVVSYESGDELVDVARFATEEEAEAFAAAENKRIEREYTSRPFLTLHLPDNWEPQVGSVTRGKYPQSRNMLCTLSRLNADGGWTSAEAYAHWDARGVSDHLPRWDIVHKILVDLIDKVTEAELESLAENEQVEA